MRSISQYWTPDLFVVACCSHAGHKHTNTLDFECADFHVQVEYRFCQSAALLTLICTAYVTSMLLGHAALRTSNTTSCFSCQHFSPWAGQVRRLKSALWNELAKPCEMPVSCRLSSSEEEMMPAGAGRRSRTMTAGRVDLRARAAAGRVEHRAQHEG